MAKIVGPMNATVLIVTDYRGYIPQLLSDTESLDIGEFESALRDYGWNCTVTKYASLDFQADEYDGSYVLYASSQAPAYKRYIEDNLQALRAAGAQLVPDFSLFLAHEDKLMQSLLLEGTDLNYPSTHRVGTFEEGQELMNELPYPVVGKPARGFASDQIKQINNSQEGESFLKEHLKRDYDFQKGGTLKQLYRKVRYGERYSQGVGRVIFQEKLENVDHDWKILVFNETAFALKRYTKEGDFRASGSGKFTFDERPPDRALNCALRAREELETPWLSVDVVPTEERCYVVEFQALHFGMYTYLKADNCYKKRDDSWVEEPKSDEPLERLMAESFRAVIE